MIHRLFTTMVIAVSAITLIAFSTPAESKGFFDSLFGGNQDEAQKGPPPEVTLQAPFPTNSTPAKSNSQLMDMYGKGDDQKLDLSDISKPHRNEGQITEWAMEIVTQAMTINLKTYEKDFKKISPLFTPYAMKEYQDYLQKTNMMNVLSSNQYRLQAISDEEGSVVKDGEIGGTYHWLVQIPLMISFYKEDMEQADKSSNIQSQSLLIQVQVGRVKPKNGADIGLVAERWMVSSNAKQ